MILLYIYLAGINLALLALMGRDKRAAGNGAWRTKETTLLSLAVLGGAAGGILGMLLFRHKTRKPDFAVGLPVILLAQIAIAMILPR